MAVMRGSESATATASVTATEVPSQWKSLVADFTTTKNNQRQTYFTNQQHNLSSLRPHAAP